MTYDSIFISGNYNISYKLGFLNYNKEKFKNIKYWYCSGASSIILFLKCLGFDYSASLEKIKELNIYCFSNKINLFTIEDDEFINFDKVEKWVKKCFKDSRLFNHKMTLNEIYKKTGVKPKFIVWNDTLKKIMIMSNETKISDCILASLPNYGSFNNYEIGNMKYSSIEDINPYPYEYIKHNLDKCFFIMDLIVEIKKDNTKGLYDRIINYQLECYNNKISFIYSKLENNIDNSIILKCCLDLDAQNFDTLEN